VTSVPRTAGYGEVRCGMARQGSVGFGWAGQGMAGLGWAVLGKAGSGRAGDVLRPGRVTDRNHHSEERRYP
jgi:hypothetical protein